MSMLSMTNVTYQIPNGKMTLGPITGEIHAGQFVALIGPNGAGKSTLLKLIATLLRHQEGLITVNEQEVQRLSPSKRAHQLAFVPQTLDTQFDLTVEEVVELGRLSHLSWSERLRFQGRISPEKVEQVMRNTETWDLRHRAFKTLSGGEAKRTLLAAALIQEAPVLLLDEPTAHLDPGHAMKFLDLVRSMVERQKTTVLMAYHDLTTVGLYADFIWVIDHGQILKMGTPEEVLTDPLIQQIYDAPLLEIPHPRSQRPMLIFP